MSNVDISPSGPQIFLHWFGVKVSTPRQCGRGKIFFGKLMAAINYCRFSDGRVQDDGQDALHHLHHGHDGYVAPEYALYDYVGVFSFDIVVLELLKGHRAFDSSTNRLEHILVSDWVVDMSQNGHSTKIIDERIQHFNCRQSMEKVLLLAL
ncbi:hypothetical protein SUGI_0544680 [Cryptomeria japonica]|nr:hypothetical protein SUGI_0544680 [Cryptomeria japonica]